jgi:hypothetical protein
LKETKAREEEKLKNLLEQQQEEYKNQLSLLQESLLKSQNRILQVEEEMKLVSETHEKEFGDLKIEIENSKNFVQQKELQNLELNSKISELTLQKEEILVLKEEKEQNLVAIEESFRQSQVFLIFLRNIKIP